ncbi:MAG: hypothetical protein ACK2UK_09875 [Candidatus Promineifilaceae bacterium]|jgi:hypothetical protein
MKRGPAFEEPRSREEWLLIIGTTTGLGRQRVEQCLVLAGVDFAVDGLVRCESAVLEFGPQITAEEFRFGLLF